MTDRRPQLTAARIATLPNLPLFHDVTGKTAVVFGASNGADWKAELLAAAGARVRRLADDWTHEDLAGAAIAIADIADRAEARRFVDAAHAAGALVNIVDRTDLCDVQFGTIVNRAPILIAISTDGAAPMLGQSIRARIESIIPPRLSAWASAAKEWRLAVKRSVAGFAERRRFWERFVERAWANSERPPVAADFDALIGPMPAAEGRVAIVGAGPGDAGLLTLNAVRALQTATVILHDDLVGPDVLELARREARRIAVGKKGHGPSCKQSDINQRMIGLALAGESVVRLKGGDPMIFGRASEEINACRAAGVPVSVVPGISAAQGASASLRMSLTERRVARRVQFLTGHGMDGKLPQDIDWLSVADRKVTTVLYMPRKTLGRFVRKALAKGLDPRTPAVAIASATLPDEHWAAGPITQIQALAEGLRPGAPVAVIIGWVGQRLVSRANPPVPFRLAAAS